MTQHVFAIVPVDLFMLHCVTGWLETQIEHNLFEQLFHKQLSY